ncbi:MAG: 8-oxoguanine DNA glycosylase [Oscillospiraceae bacterium]|nr:8-oxoguanine DNA glycosylase [Oscillospiraceae bacterium]
MKEQTYILKNKNSFNLVHIFECGQCFRWNRDSNGIYKGVVGNSVLSAQETAGSIIFKGIVGANIVHPGHKNSLESVVKEYFNLDTDYTIIKRNLSKIDQFLKTSIEYGNGIRILKQDIWECIISFIISANNNIPRIKKTIEKLCKTYGKAITWGNDTYYTFPTPEELSKASIEDLRSLGLGFRDKRVYDTTKMILNKEIDIELLKNIADVNMIREELMKLPGVGEKVADCILLFGFNRFEVFPVDVWVRRVMNDLYVKNSDETKVSKEELQNLAKSKYGKLAGLAQQYLFYWRRSS